MNDPNHNPSLNRNPLRDWPKRISPFCLSAFALFALLIFNFAFAARTSAFPRRPSVEEIGNRKSQIVNSLADVPSPSASTFGSWLISAAAALSIVAVGRQFVRKTPIEAEFLTRREFQDFKDKDFAELRCRIEKSHETLANKLDTITDRLSDVGALVARVDERTKLHSCSSHQQQGSGITS